MVPASDLPLLPCLPGALIPRRVQCDVCQEVRFRSNLAYSCKKCIELEAEKITLATLHFRESVIAQRITPLITSQKPLPLIPIRLVNTWHQILFPRDTFKTGVSRAMHRIINM